MASDSALPTVSVIIPAYNAAAHIGTAIASALGQTRPPLEIIVVDDGSTDHTAEFVVERFPEVILLRQENRGCGPARNTGCAIARGDWLAFLDADDEWLPRKLERQLTLAANSRVAVINARRASKAGVLLDAVIPFETIWRRNVLAVSSTLVRRAAFEAAGGFWAERYCEDYHLWLRLSGSGWRIANYPEDLTIYRPALGSLSQQTGRFAAAERKCIRDAALHLRLPAQQLEDRLLDSYVAHAYSAICNRDMALSRRMLTESLAVGVSARQVSLLIASRLPAVVFDLRRAIMALVNTAQGSAETD